MIKIGQGYDSHRFRNGEYVIIGGVKIKSKKSVLAHSDGDVLIHALCDAILGAAGKGDMGLYFNDSKKFENIDSKFFLEEIMSIVRDDNYEIGNIDATIITEEPPISKHAKEIEKNLCEIIKIDEGQINVKSKSNDKLGYLGRHEGIEAHVSVLLKKI